MRPKVNADTVYLPVDEGAYFRNSHGSMLLKGKHAYRWMVTLAPLLNGEHELEELTSGLDTDRATTVLELIQALHENRFLRDVSQDLPHGLSDGVMNEYAPEIAFLDSFRDSGAYSFARFRSCHVLLIGSGLVMELLVRAALRSGLQRIGVLATQECEPHHHLARESLEQFRRDTAQTLRESASPDWADEASLAEVLTPFDAVIHVSDRAMLGRAKLLNRLCAAQTKPLLQAITVEDRTWIGPLSDGKSGSCWECGWRRLQANLGHFSEQFPRFTFEDHADAPISHLVAIPTAGVVANRLIFEVFQFLAEAGPRELAGSLIEINLETLESQRHPFSPHPLCSNCVPARPRTRSEFLEGIGHLERSGPRDAEDFSQEAVGVFDSRTGILGALEEGDISQLPLFVSTATVSNPMLANTFEDPIVVLESGVSFRLARSHVAQRGLEVYSASLVDQRQLVHTPPPEDAPTVEPTECFWNAPASGTSSASKTTAEHLWTWAYALDTQEAHLVPASCAFPSISGTIDLDDVTIGIGSGMTWAEAVARALLSWCRHLTLRDMQNRTRPYRQVDLSAVSLEPEGTRQRRLLDLVSDMVTVYDVTGALRVPTFAICIDDAVCACSADTDVSRALREGFEQALRYYQLDGKHTTGCREVQMPDSFLRLRDTARKTPQSVAPSDWSASLDWLQKALRDSGWRALAVPLDHDRIVSGVLPYLVRVLLAQA